MTIEIRGHHICIFKYWIDEKFDRPPVLSNNHHQEQTFIDIYNSLLNNPDSEIKITDSHDDICRVCNYFDGKNCKERTDGELSTFDMEEIKKFGLSCNSVYTSRELVEMLRK